jgi:hypothetical protein
VNMYGTGYESEAAYVHVPPEYAPVKDGSEDNREIQDVAVVMILVVSGVILAAIVLHLYKRRT